MQQIFLLDTLKTYLLKETKSLIIKLSAKDQKNLINKQLIEDFNSVLNWVCNHIEIKSILITTDAPTFCSGLDEDEIINLSSKQLIELLTNLQKLIYSMLYLPQTVIFDLKNGADGKGIELSMSADIRLAHQDGTFQFNQLKNGLTPCSGGVGLLSQWIPMSLLKYWYLDSKELSSLELKNFGLIHQLYNTESTPHQIPSTHIEILKNIDRQSSIQRIQCKRLFLENTIKELNHLMSSEQKIGHAGLIAEDWKNAIISKQKNEIPNFMDPRTIKAPSQQTDPDNYS